MNKITIPLVVCAILAVVLMTIPAVSAAVTWVTPLSGSNHSSAITLGVMWVNATDLWNVTEDNSSLYYSIDSGTTWTTAAFTWGTINASESGLSGTLAIATIADNSDIDLNMTLGNQTDTLTMEATGVITNVKIDDTVPTLSVEPRDGISYGSLFEYMCYDNLADTTAPAVTHPSGDTTARTALTGDDASTDAKRTFTDTDYEGTYVFYCLDEGTLNAATNASRTVGVLGHPGSIQGTTGETSNLSTILIIGGIAVIAYFLFKKK